MERVFIAGGTGLLGYHSALQFIKKGIKVATIALPEEIEIGSWFPSEIDLSYGDLFTMSDEEMIELFSKNKYDCFVYALGPDERYTPDYPAFDFFYEKLVVQSTRIISNAKKAGIKRIVVLNSYFAYFDRLKKGKLSKHHPYIKARVLQANSAISLGDDKKIAVMILELPYIFGTMPNREPIWRKSFLSKITMMENVYFPKGGGTAVIDVIGVGQAIVAAAINGKHGVKYPIGNGNMTFDFMINTMLKSINMGKKYIGIPTFIASMFGRKIKKEQKMLLKEGGLNYAKLMTQIQSKRFFINQDVMKEDLGFEKLGFDGGKDIIKSIKESMKACYPERFTKENKK